MFYRFLTSKKKKSIKEKEKRGKIYFILLIYVVSVMEQAQGNTKTFSSNKSSGLLQIKVRHWHAVGKWDWDFSEDTCAICQFSTGECCPNCKYPGNSCPPGKKQQ